MHIREFDVKAGFYAFTTDNLSTSLHAHPALEIVVAVSGSLTFEYNEQVFSELRGVVIPPNLRHRLIATGGELLIYLADAGTGIDWLALNCPPLAEASGPREIPDAGATRWSLAALSDRHQRSGPPLDFRVQYCLEQLPLRLREDNLSITILAAECHLSASRLSHVFKREVGVSLSKYLLWARLRAAVADYLSGKQRLLDAALNAGFYDAAHFSRVFREMLGEKPSFAYNSNTVQD